MVSKKRIILVFSVAYALFLTMARADDIDFSNLLYDLQTFAPLTTHATRTSQAYLEQHGFDQ